MEGSVLLSLSAQPPHNLTLQQLSVGTSSPGDPEASTSTLFDLYRLFFGCRDRCWHKKQEVEVLLSLTSSKVRVSPSVQALLSVEHYAGLLQRQCSFLSHSLNWLSEPAAAAPSSKAALEDPTSLKILLGGPG